MPDESLKSESTILLMGREVSDLQVAKGKTDNRIARIYSFAYQNEIVDLASPALFVVSGKGKKVENSIAASGVSKFEGTFAADLEYWEVDRDDTGVRLDVMRGTLTRILLDYELADDGLQDFVRGSTGVGRPSSLGGQRSSRARRWRSDDD